MLSRREASAPVYATTAACIVAFSRHAARREESAPFHATTATTATAQGAEPHSTAARRRDWTIRSACYTAGRFVITGREGW